MRPSNQVWSGEMHCHHKRHTRNQHLCLHRRRLRKGCSIGERKTSCRLESGLCYACRRNFRVAAADKRATGTVSSTDSIKGRWIKCTSPAKQRPPCGEGNPTKDQLKTTSEGTHAHKERLHRQKHDNSFFCSASPTQKLEKSRNEKPVEASQQQKRKHKEGASVKLCLEFLLREACRAHQFTRKAQLSVGYVRSFCKQTRSPLWK